MDIVFILDDSGSIGMANFRKSQKFVSDLVNKLDIDNDVTKFGFMTFSTSVEMQFDMGGCETT